ncbi:hypothetical protein UN63_09340 [Oceanisphaera arctica]|uniref:Uncharacterized protein n=1 Tax=Oceanisphaera arctica TaxID=641510 RepID=A0A2P5TLT6_9GAMM|nr:hypothetical protein UN63_09340 [Oceanisphaera arctica]
MRVKGVRSADHLTDMDGGNAGTAGAFPGRAKDAAVEPQGGELARRDEPFQPDRISSEYSQQAETASVMSYGVSAEWCPLPDFMLP